MPEPVQITRAAPAPARASATADAQRRVLVVVDAATVRAAGPAARTALTMLAGAPWPLLAQQAERGVSVVVGGAPNARVAAELAADIRSRHDVPARVLDPGGSGALGTALFTGLLSPVVAVVGLIGAALGLGWAAALLGLGLAVALGVGAGLAARSHSAATAAARRARRETEEATRATAAWPEVWASLLDLRRRSLDDALPPAAAADLWMALDRAEARLLDGDAPEGIARALQGSAADLAGDPSAPLHEATSTLRRAAASARAALDEVERPGPARPRRTPEGS